MITIESIEDLKHEYKALNRTRRATLEDRIILEHSSKYITNLYKDEIKNLDLNYKTVRNMGNE